MSERPESSSSAICDHASRCGDGLHRRLGELTVPALLVCEHGLILTSNQIHEVLRGPVECQHGVTTVRDVLGERFAAATMDLAARVMGDGRTRHALVMWRGRWIRVRYAPVATEGMTCCLIHVDPWRDSIFELQHDVAGAPEEFPVHDLGDLCELSAREAEVLWMLGQGQSLPQIARALSRSTKTIETHVRAIANKTSVRGRFGMGLFARDRGLCRMTLEQVGRIFAARPSSRQNGSMD